MSEQAVRQLATAEWEVEDLFTITQFSTKPCRSSAIAMPAMPAVIRCDVIIVRTAGFARSRCQCLWPCLWPRCGLLRDKKGRLLEGRAGFHAGETQGRLVNQPAAPGERSARRQMLTFHRYAPSSAAWKRGRSQPVVLLVLLVLLLSPASGSTCS